MAKSLYGFAFESQDSCLGQVLVFRVPKCVKQKIRKRQIKIKSPKVAIQSSTNSGARRSHLGTNPLELG